MAQIITANRLDDGLVVFLTATGWSENARDAQVGDDAEATAALLARAQQDEVDRKIVAPYEIDVVVEEAGPWPTLLREVIRAEGPTRRTDPVDAPGKAA